MSHARTRFAPFLVSLLVLAACRGTPERLPSGQGLVSVDRDAPSGAEVFDAPAWKVGDRFVYRKGGLARIAFRLERTDGGVHRLVDEQSGLTMLVGQDLTDRGQEKPGAPELAVIYDPADYPLTWPLWPGKRWSCHYVSRAPGRGDVPLLVRYECDAMEEVRVPAGTFRCLRIWRRARPAAEGGYLERVSVAWYAPEVGTIVRRLSDSLLIEAEEIDRQ